jgi:hypothetical protein
MYHHTWLKRIMALSLEKAPYAGLQVSVLLFFFVCIFFYSHFSVGEGE